MTVKRVGESPTAQETLIIKMWKEKRLSCMHIARVIQVPPDSVYRVIQYWCDPTLNFTKTSEPQKVTTMAKSDKNKKERTKNMEKLREGDPIYSLEMDKMRGMYAELEPGECFIVIRQAHNADKVNLRLGDVAYTQ